MPTSGVCWLIRSPPRPRPRCRSGDASPRTRCGNGLVRPVAGLRERGAERAHGEDASAGRDHSTVRAPRSPRGTRARRPSPRPRRGRAISRAVRTAPGSRRRRGPPTTHAADETTTVLPTGFRPRTRGAARRGPSAPSGRRLGLGIAEPAVELEHLRAVGGEHQPRVQDAPVRRPPRAAPARSPTSRPRRSAARSPRRRTAPASTRPSRRCSDPCRRPRPACGPGRRRAGGPGRRRSGRTPRPPRPPGYSSITTVAPASPNARSSRHAWAAPSASARSAVITTPLPAARPSALTTYGGLELVGAPRRAAVIDVTAGDAPPGCRGARTGPCAHAFEPSIRAPSARRAEHGRPRSRSASASPATSGASGPTTVRSTSSRSASGDDPADVVRRDVHAAGELARSPGCPGAATSSATEGLRASRHTRACSRPPAADDQDPHRADGLTLRPRPLDGRLCSRPGPTETTPIGTPTSSARRSRYVAGRRRAGRRTSGPARGPRPSRRAPRRRARPRGTASGAGGKSSNVSPSAR